MDMKPHRLVVGISGASGVILGIRLLEVLKSIPVETHLIVTHAAQDTILRETDWKIKNVLALANAVYEQTEVSAPIASGSFRTMGMVVIPCSIKTLSAIANSFNADLLVRAADVTLKESRPLVLVVRETPLHYGHLRLMSLASRAGAVIYPPVPAFYTRPGNVQDIIDNLVGRILRRVGIENELFKEWGD
jgi:4-hydroxy-3-polyprenylbenzoate decarboxylase